ncbi:MAG: N-acetylneuraminate synthase family protein [bacterium]
MIEIIAEIGQNHNGDMNLAKEMIRRVKEAGADVAKFQVFDARAVFSKENNPWYEYNLSTELSRRQVELLARECDEVGIEFMASAFDPERVAWLEECGVRRYKMASRSIHDKPLIEALIDTAKPLIVSLGHWSEEEFPAIDTAGSVDFLYCVSKYPTPLEEVRLAEIDFNRYTGFSDHTVGLTASFAAMARGARIIEKHFTLDHEMFGPDHLGSVDPDQLKTLCTWRDEISVCLGEVAYA